MLNKKTILSIAIASALTFSILTPSKINAVTISEGTVTAQSLTVRTGPSASHSAMDWIKKGTKVTIIKDHGKFSYVQYGNKKGYVHDSYLKIITKAVDSANNLSVKKATVTATSLTVRKGASSSHGAIDWIKKGTNVTILKEHGTFVYIQYGNKKGYVHVGYLKVSSATSTPVLTPKPAPSVPTNSGANTVHTVKSGETLWKISVNYKTTVEKIKALNNLHSNVIKVGQKLTVNGSKPVEKPNPNIIGVSKQLNGQRIVIDAGHGGKFPGAQGIVHEEDVNLQISLKLRDKLQSLGATVIMTRTTDKHLAEVRANDLIARQTIAKNNKATMFISIHANAGGASADGTEVYWYGRHAGDKSLASNIVKEITKKTGLDNRGAKFGDFSVIRNSGSSYPSVLVETAFVTNKKDAAILGSASGQDNIVVGIANGILNYLK